MYLIILKICFQKESPPKQLLLSSIRNRRGFIRSHILPIVCWAARLNGSGICIYEQALISCLGPVTVICPLQKHFPPSGVIGMHKVRLIATLYLNLAKSCLFFHFIQLSFPCCNHNFKLCGLLVKSRTNVHLSIQNDANIKPYDVKDNMMFDHTKCKNTTMAVNAGCYLLLGEL